MDTHHFAQGIKAGMIAGVIWGWAALGFNYMSGTFPFEAHLINNFIIFSVGGGIFGLVAGSFMAITEERLPFKGLLPKAVFLSTSLWLVFRIGGFLLSSADIERYHPDMTETLQGFVLALIMGGILGTTLGWLRKREF